MDKGNLDDSVDNDSEGQLLVAEADRELEVKRMHHLLASVTFLDLKLTLPQDQPR